jgi:hypothetical protein
MGNGNAMMISGEVWAYTAFLVPALLVLFYFATFVRVLIGSKHIWVVKLIVMLFVTNFATLLVHLVEKL